MTASTEAEFRTSKSGALSATGSQMSSRGKTPISAVRPRTLGQKMHKNKAEHPDVTSIVHDLLIGEAFHCDGFYEEAGSFDAALKKQKQTVSFLYKTICEDQALFAVARRIFPCKNGPRCLSAACPVCAKAFQNAETQLGY